MCHCFAQLHALSLFLTWGECKLQVCSEAGSACHRVDRAARCVSAALTCHAQDGMIRANRELAMTRRSGLEWEAASLRQRREHLLQVYALFGRRLVEHAAVWEGVQGFCAWHRMLLHRQVRLIRAHHHGHAVHTWLRAQQRWLGWQDLRAQRAHLIERAAVVHTEHEQEDITCTTEERRGTPSVMTMRKEIWPL